MHHIFTGSEFHPVEQNLRECFRVLAACRALGDVLELPGVTIASSGVAFQMFNAAFLSSPVDTIGDLEHRIQRAQTHFASRGLRWSFWCCDGWIAKGLRRKAASVFEKSGLNYSSEMPGMSAVNLLGTSPGRVELRRVVSGHTLRDFRQIGALCFHVPPVWFEEVFDEEMANRPGFSAWVAYESGAPVGTAGTVVNDGVTGLYNIAVLPEYRRRGYGSEITRAAAEAATDGVAPQALILQASSQGFRMYERMGFRTVTQVIVYNST